MKAIYGKNIFIDGKFVNATVFFDQNGIKEVVCGKAESDNLIDIGDDYLAPGFIDIHTHGAKGVDFADGSPDEIIEAIKYHLSNGVTGILPTITSSTVERTLAALKNLETAMAHPEYGKCILGAHLEGPYLSLAQSGAQDKDLITPPIEKDYNEIIKKFGHIIKRWDYAPERDEGCKFAKALSEKGILPSAGHTDAKYLDMIEAKKHGCNLITHFYSCTSTITRELGVRKLGVLECGYLWDDMYIEIIADGKHLPIELLQLIFKLKPSDKIILVSDSLKVAGSNEKYSSVGTVKCVIEDGVCKLLDRSAFAGSIASGIRLIKTCIEAGQTIETAIKTFTVNPAKLFDNKGGKIEKGFKSNFVVLDKDASIKKIILFGEEVN